MADDFQYVKMPDGSYGKFPGTASDDEIRSFLTSRFPEATAPQPAYKPGIPAPEMKTSALGTLYDVATKAPGVAKELAPVAAGTAAGIMSGPWAPLTAPLAYASTEGLINPKEIQQHPIEEGIAAGTMAIPGPLEAARYAFPKFAFEHPVMMRGLGGLAGAAIGGLLGEEAGGHSGLPYGSYGGGASGVIGGGLLGFGMGTKLSGAEGEQLVRDAFSGKRSLSELPPELADKARALILRSAKRAAEMAQLTGQDVETLNVPSTVGRTAEQMIETRARMVPELPRAVLTPEEMSAREQAGRYYGVMKEDIDPEGRVIGSAHQTYRQRQEFVPSKRGMTTKESQTFRVRPKLSITE